MIKPGDVVGDFEIVREVGRGGMGVVFEGRQRSLPRRVAVKVLLDEKRRSALEARRFRAEADAAARLSHPGIVPVFGVGSHRGAPWFAMEFVEGRTVRDVVKAGGPMEVRQAAAIVRDAARAIDHAHAQGVLHRDVKPGNLMIRPDGRVVVTDFGLSKAMTNGKAPAAKPAENGLPRRLANGSVSSSHSYVGTPFYMSPEQAQGLPVSPATDVYGLGVTLYKMLAGKAPFEERSTAKLVRAIRETPPPPLERARPGCPRDLVAIVNACMAKSPQDRYASAGAVADDLAKFLRGEPTSLRAPTWVEGARRLIRDHRKAVAVGSALLLAGSLAWLAMAQRASSAPPTRARRRRRARVRATS